MIEAAAEWRDGACHCGGVRFRVRLSGGLAAARRCSCSLYAMRGAVALTARRDDLHIVDGADRLAVYQFNTGTAEHHFCSICGIYTHHRRRSNPGEYGVNAACLGVSPFDLPAVPVLDGQHHPADGDGSSLRLGTLHFLAADGGEPAA